MAGDQQLRAFIERILRLKEEQDTLAADIREVYAEAKGSGFDKTAMGQLVAHLRKVEKVGVAAVEEGQSVFDTYLDAYRRATRASHTYAPARAREIIEQFDAETGEITEHEQPETAADDGQKKSVSSALSSAIESEDSASDVGSASSTHSNPQPTSSPDADKTGEAATPLPVSPVALSDDDVPTFLKKDKDGCLKLKDGHCRIGFATSALCSECNAARSKARAGA